MRSARSGLSQVRDSLSGRSHFSSWVVRWLGVLALGVTYVVTAQLCVYLANTGKNPAALWIPSGVALAALVRFGPRMWPGVFLGSLVANLLVDLPLPAALLLAGGNALDAWLSVWGIRRVTGERLDFGRTRHVLAFIGWGAVIGPAVSGAFGVLSLQLGGVYDSLADEVTGWVGWTLEDGLSVLIISSLLLVAARARRWDWRGRTRLVEAAVLLALVTVTSWLVLTRAHGDPLSEPYLMLPLMLLVVLRLGSPGAIVGNLVLTVLAGWTVVNREGPFVLDTLTASMWWMQSFSAVASLTTLLLAAALNEARAERYRQMFNGNRTIQLVVEARTGRIVDANPAACTFYGHPSSAMRELSLGHLASLATDDSAGALATVLSEGHAYFVSRHRTRDGQLREVEVDCNAMQIDGRTLIYAIVHDMTARRRAEEALRQSEERLQLVARATNDTVWDWDMRANTIWHNEGLRTVFGHTGEAEATSLAWMASHIHPEDRDRVLATLDAAAARGDETWSQEYRFRRGDDSYAHVFARGYILYESSMAIRMVGVLLDLSERKHMEVELAHRATHDALTGLANRWLIESTLRDAIVLSARQRTPMALLIADLDHFKEINDTLGHHVGDVVLQVVGERWRSVIRQDDVLGRLAGDEFAVILPGAGGAAADATARRLVRALDEPISVDGLQLRVGTSVGLASFPEDALDAADLVRRADHAMYASKRQGGGFVPSPSMEKLGAARRAPLRRP